MLKSTFIISTYFSNDPLSYLGFPGDSDDKESICSTVGLGSLPGTLPWRRAWQPTPVFWPGGLQSTGSQSRTSLSDFHYLISAIFMSVFSYLFIKHPGITPSAYQQTFFLASAIVKSLLGSLNTYPIWNLPWLHFWDFPHALGFLLWHGLLSSFVFFLLQALLSGRLYFCLPCNLINAGWWK